MLREINENEMMMVSGGTASYCVATATGVECHRHRTGTASDFSTEYDQWMNSIDAYADEEGSFSTPVEDTATEDETRDPCAELDALELRLLTPIDRVVWESGPSRDAIAGTLAVFSLVGHAGLAIRRVENGC